MTETTGTTSRRALLGIGGVAAAAVFAAQATADPASASPAAESIGAATPLGPPRPRAVAFRPMLGGGPSTVDESAAAAMRSATTAAVPVGRQFSSYSAAAAEGALHRVASPVFDAGTIESHLLRRATFGARASDVADLKKYGIDGWLKRQLSPKTLKDPDGDAAWAAFSLAGAGPKKILSTVDDYGWDAMLHTAYASIGRQMFSRRQVFEITVDIFANLLHVPIPHEQWATSPGYLKNVIRKYAFGKYSSMLKAAMKHPAMLNFLNNDESVKEHVNENLGRELLELHTVGIAGGYTEDDVKDSAKILSGRSWVGRLQGRRKTYGQYTYNADDHYTGPVKVLGFVHANSSGSHGEKVGDDYLYYLAHQRSTALKIARKIATRFVSDSPSDDLLNRLADVYLDHDTDIREVVKAVFRSSDFWSATGTRMRRPLEDAVGAARVLGVTRGSKVKKALSHMFWSLDEAGHTPHGWLPPNGYPDVAGAWLGAGAMIHRWNVHRAYIYWGFEFSRTWTKSLFEKTSTSTADVWVRKVALKLLGVPISDEHVAAVLSGSEMAPDLVLNESWHQWHKRRAVALLLDSPYFQLR